MLGKTSSTALIELQLGLGSGAGFSLPLRPDSEGFGSAAVEESACRHSPGSSRSHDPAHHRKDSGVALRLKKADVLLPTRFRRRDRSDSPVLSKFLPRVGSLLRERVYSFSYDRGFAAFSATGESNRNITDQALLPGSAIEGQDFSSAIRDSRSPPCATLDHRSFFAMVSTVTESSLSSRSSFFDFFARLA